MSDRKDLPRVGTTSAIDAGVDRLINPEYIIYGISSFDSCKAKVAELVEFIDQFLEHHDLVDIMATRDIVLTPKIIELEASDSAPLGSYHAILRDLQDFLRSANAQAQAMIELEAESKANPKK